MRESGPGPRYAAGMRSSLVAFARFVLLGGLSLAAACGGEDASQETKVTLSPRTPALTGYVTVTGTVTVAPPLPEGARVVLGLNAGRPGSLGIFDESAETRAPAASSTISYRIKELAPADAYSVFVGVDLDDNGVIGPGDLGGYYDGSTVLPFTDPSAARLIGVRRNQDGLNFGIGLIGP